jgi:hypothetical protein
MQDIGEKISEHQMRGIIHRCLAKIYQDALRKRIPTERIPDVLKVLEDLKRDPLYQDNDTQCDIITVQVTVELLQPRRA